MTNILSLIIKFTLFLNFINISYDIINFFIGDESQTVSLVRTILSTSMNVISTVCGILNTIYNSGSLEENSFWEIFKRLFDDDIRKKSNKIIKSLETIETCNYKNFRESIRNNLLTRISKSKLFQMILTLFFYFNVIVNMMLYSGNIELGSTGKKSIFLFFNVISPLFCSLISLVVIFYDNINSIDRYIEKVKNILNSTAPFAAIEIEEFCEKINQPVIPF